MNINTFMIIVGTVNFLFIVASVISLFNLNEAIEKQDVTIANLEIRTLELKKELENRKQEIEKQKKMIRLASGEL